MRNETLYFRDSMNHRIANNIETETQKKAPEYLQRVWRKLNKCEGPEDYKEVLKEYRDRVKRWSKRKLKL